MRLLAVLLLLAAPLAAQDRNIAIVPAETTNEITINLDSIALGVTIELPPPDSAAVARDEAAQRTMDAIAGYLENCGCVNTGSSRATVLANAGLTLAAFFIGWQLKRIADKEEGDDIHNEGDVTVEVSLPPPEPDDSEGREP